MRKGSLLVNIPPLKYDSVLEHQADICLVCRRNRQSQKSDHEEDYIRDYNGRMINRHWGRGRGRAQVVHGHTLKSGYVSETVTFLFSILWYFVLFSTFCCVLYSF